MATQTIVQDAEEELNPYRWIILFGLVTAAILEVLDTTIVNVALPQMAGNLGATSQEISWVSTGYILSNVVVLPLTAWLAARFGRKLYLSASIILFMIASLFCGLSHTLGELVLWRIVQGAGGAALLSTAQSTIREIFPLKQQGLVQSIYVLGLICAPTIGPTLGGWITDNYSWPWVFLVNLPIGVISLLTVTSFLQDSQFAIKVGRVDWWGIGLLGVGLSSMQYVLEEGSREDWFASSLIIRLSIVAFVCLAAFLWWELSPRNAEPVVNLRVLKNRDLSAALALFLALGFGLYGGVFIFPLFAQNILHFTPTITGLVLMPGAIATGAATLIVGRISSGEKPLVSARVVILFGMALFTPINLAALSSLRGPEIAQGVSLLNLMRQLGGSFGIAYLGTHIANMSQRHHADLVRNIYPGNPAFEERMTAISGAFMARGYDAAQAHDAALASIAGLVQTQAAVMSYNDAFLLIGLAMVVVSPCVFLLRANVTKVAGADAGH